VVVRDAVVPPQAVSAITSVSAMMVEAMFMLVNSGG
jgi:hypothetical protein